MNKVCIFLIHYHTDKTSERVNKKNFENVDIASLSKVKRLKREGNISKYSKNIASRNHLSI